MELFNLTIDNVNKVDYENTLLSYTSGYRVLIGDPGSNKTTFSIWSMRELLKLKKIDSFVYVDFDSKSGEQANMLAETAKKEGWLYITSMNPTIKAKLKTNRDVLSYVFKNVPNNSGVIIDTWNKILDKESDNDQASKTSSLIKEYSVQKNLLVDVIGHYGKDKTKKLRGASSTIGDATFVLEFNKVEEGEINIQISKDSLGRCDSKVNLMKFTFVGEGITDVDIKITSEGEELKIMTPQEARDLLVAQQKYNITLYTASYLSTLKEPISKTNLRKFILQNINRLKDGKIMLQTEEDYLPTSLVKVCFSEILDTEFIVTKEGRTSYVKPIEAKDFVREHIKVKVLPNIYTTKDLQC